MRDSKLKAVTNQAGSGSNDDYGTDHALSAATRRLTAENAEQEACLRILPAAFGLKNA